MDDVLFRSYTGEQEEQPEDQVIFPSLEGPVYGPRRYPEGPATFTPGLGPTPPSRESLPPPEGALFTPMSTQEPQRRNPFQQFLDFIGITSADYGRVMRELGAQATSQFERSAEVGEQVGSSVMSRYFLGEFPESAEEATWDNFFMNQYMQYAPEGTTEEELQPYVDAAANRALLFQYEPLDLVLGDAADVARTAAPLLSLIAPANLTRMMNRYKDIEFVPARILANAPGNELRRTPEEMAVLREEIMANPEGITDPIMVSFNTRTGRWYVAEGNHRVALAAEANIPLPVVVVKNDFGLDFAIATQPSPEDVVERVRRGDGFGYIPSAMAPSDIGLPVVPMDEVVRYTDMRAARGEVPADEAAAFRDFAATYQPQYRIPGTTPIATPPAEAAIQRNEELFTPEELQKINSDIDAWENASGIPAAPTSVRQFDPRNVEQLFNLGELPEQSVTSAKTSIQQRRGSSSAAPAVFTWLQTNRPLRAGSINLDIGGGRFDDTTEYVRQQFGADNLVYDPFNRTPEHNQNVINQVISSGGADTATISNVLNVIPEQTNRVRVIRQALEGLKPGGQAFFSVYPGNRSGQGAFTGADQYQANMPIQDYLPLIEQVFGAGNVERRGNIIIATRP